MIAKLCQTVKMSLISSISFHFIYFSVSTVSIRTLEKRLASQKIFRKASEKVSQKYEVVILRRFLMKMKVVEMV